MSGTELVGYAASALVVVSLTMRSILRLRIISLCGSITFLTYGLLIESAPIVITNVCIASINLWFLRKEVALATSGARDLGVSPIRPDSPFLLDFIRYHLSDIGRFQPDFTMPVDPPGSDDVVSLLLTREGLPAGTVIGHRARPDDDTLVIDLDYVLREHRDSRLGVWLYGPGAEIFRRLGFTRLRADALTADHEKYLRRVGFDPTPDEHGEAFELRL